MNIVVLALADLVSAFQRLLPTGRAWRRDTQAVITQTITALLPNFQRCAANAVGLLTQTFPATTVDLIPEWEASLGLPNGCTPLGQTIAQQQAQIVAQLIASGGQSISYFLSVCTALGFPGCTITDGPANTYTWTINVPGSATDVVFRAGENRAGDLLEYFQQNALLECVLNRIKPAHTVLSFSY